MFDFVVHLESILSLVEMTKKEKNINKLISVSKELKVELTELTYSDIKEIENSIKRTEEANWRSAIASLLQPLLTAS